MPSSKPARRFADILENIEAIAQYTQGLDLERFTTDRKTRDAVERCLERISEASAKLGAAGPLLAPDQPWPQIKALGNQIRHAYDRLRGDVLWEIVTQDLPALRTACVQALQTLQKEDPPVSC